MIDFSFSEIGMAAFLSVKAPRSGLVGCRRRESQERLVGKLGAISKWALALLEEASLEGRKSCGWGCLIEEV